MAHDNQSPAEPTPEPALLVLAREKFGALSQAEEELFRAAQGGRPASALDPDEKENDPANATNWKAERVVRAKCLAWVCTEPQASALLTHQGVDIRGMRIDGELNLDNAEVKFPLLASNCAFSENISLRDAQLRRLSLAGCHIKRLDAVLATFNRSLYLRHGFKSEGGVKLARATIDGDLDCVNAQFSNAEGSAFNADGMKIEGSVFLSRGFKAEGEVNLIAITIRGDLNCRGGQFSNASGLALGAAGAKIDGSVFFNNDFKAEGKVDLLGSTIGGDLGCVGGQFLNGNGLALDASVAEIGGNTYLRDGFKAEGEVSLMAATMGNLQISDAIGADKVTFDLRLTQVGAFCDDEQSWPEEGNLFLDGFRYERFYGNAPLDADSRKKWLSLQPQDKFLPQPYEQLAAVLRQMGHEPDARLVMIEKNRDRARFTNVFRQSWWWYNVFGRLIGYGYAPWRAFAMSVAMILLGTFLFHLGSTHDLISPTSEKAYAKEPNGQLIVENGQKKISEEYPTFNAFFYSLESFTPLLKLDQSANWTPNANRSAKISQFHLTVPFSGSFLRYYLYFHIASGWLLTSLWVGAITGLVKT